MLNFPNSPTTGQIFNNTWTWDGEKWIEVTGGGVSSVTAGQGLAGGGSSGSVTLALQIPVPVAFGGTGALTAPQAQINLGGPFLPLVGGTLSGPGNLTMGQTLSTGVGTTTGDVAIELGGQRTGNGNAYIDFHGTQGTDYDLRIIRNSGANGTAQIAQSGTGYLQLAGAGGVFVYQSGINDPLTVQADSGLYSRTRYNVIGTRLWSVGTTNSGTFMIADETASAGRLIIDTGGTASFNGSVSVSGNVTAGYIHSTGNINADTDIGCRSLYATGTVQGSYVHSNGDINADHQVYGAARVASGVDVWINGLLWSNNSGWMYTGSGILSSSTIQGAYVVSTGDVHANSNMSCGGTIYPNQGVNTGATSYLGNTQSNNDVAATGVFRRSLLGTGGVGARIECWAGEWGAVSLAESGGTMNFSPDLGGTGLWVSCNWFSDERLKVNIRDTQIDALAAIMATPVRAFDWNEEGQRLMPYADPSVPIGLVAQELTKTMPSAVGTHALHGNLHYVDDQHLIPYLVRAIQQLATRIGMAGI